MSPPENPLPSGAHRPQSFRRLPLFLGISVALSWPLVTWAGDILRGGASRNAPTAPGNSANTSAAAEAARANAKDALARTTQALQAVQNMQAAARAAAKSGPNNLGANPNAPTFQLPDVPDGIGPGGLEVHPNVATDPTLWTGANKPTQSGNTVNITQTSQQAVLNWKTFNVGKNTTVNFDQSAGGSNVGTWIAFNKITDPSGAPSQILGSINAAGQVYVINQNGIIFGGSSQVNVHALVASSLPINDNLITRGLLNQTAGDVQFLFSVKTIKSNGITPSLTSLPATPTGQNGDVTVQAGALLTSPTTDAHVGGKIALVGPNVTNAGTISSPDGQIILAAGLQVGMTAHTSFDPTLRGLDVYVGAVSDPSRANPAYAGTANNSGLIDAPRASVIMTGKTLNQNGVINSTTSVSLNGRVDLIASYGALNNASYKPPVDLNTYKNSPPFVYQNTGTVTFGPKSAIQILPELTSKETAVGTQLALPSIMNIQGKAVYFSTNSTLLAPGAVPPTGAAAIVPVDNTGTKLTEGVTVNAGVWTPISNQSPPSTFVHSGGQIYLDQGAMINVAGSTDVAAPLSENILNLKLRGAELADSPLQRGGLLRAVDITVDVRNSGVFNGKKWVGTPLGDVSGFVGLIKRNVGELTTAGGTVSLNAGDSVILQQGATINTSGGWLNYGGGFVQTTRVLSGGQLLDISQATPDRVYSGIYTGTVTFTNSKWGVTKTFSNPLALTGAHYEQGYLQGANGGSIAIAAASMALDGTLIGNTVAGPRQMRSGKTANTLTGQTGSSSSLPNPSSLSLALQADQIVKGVNIGLYSPTPPKVTFGANPGQAPADPFSLDATGSPVSLRTDRQAQVYLSPELLTTDGFSWFSVINKDGSIEIPQNVALATPPRGQGKSTNGSITLNGSNVTILGTVNAPGGTVSVTANNITQAVVNAQKNNTGVPLSADPTRGNVVLAPGSSISTAGLIVDERLNAPQLLALPLDTAGGSVSITAYNANLSPGSQIDVSGGVAISSAGVRTYGDAGSISIVAGTDTSQKAVIGGKFLLGSTLKGFSGAKGGLLSLQAAQPIQIGGTTNRSDVILFSPTFFNQGGFASFSMTGLGAPTDQTDVPIPGLSIAPGTVINPVVESLLAIPYGAGANGAKLVHVLKPESLRSPVSLSFAAQGYSDESKAPLSLIARGDVIMGEGSKIQTNAGGSVSFKGDTVSVLGQISAPAGSISITGKGSFPSNDVSAPLLATVFIGPSARLSAAGTVVLTPDAFGRRIGTVYPGGTISVSGNILASAGSVLDVSGTSGILDLAPSVVGHYNSPRVPVNSGVNAPLFSLATVPTRVDSDGGTITLKGSQGMLVNSQLLGFAGGPTALGGKLEVSSGRYYPPGAMSSPSDINLIVSQTKPPTTITDFGIGRPSASLGYFNPESFSKGGFDSLTLGGNVQFSDPVNITARGSLSVASGGIIAADSAVNLKAAYIKLGQAYQAPSQPKQQTSSPFALDSQSKPVVPPVYGKGILTVEAPLIDVGNLSLLGIGSLNLIADKGDIRGYGTLDVAGDIYLRAGQIYPATATIFTIAAYDHLQNGVTVPGSITVAGSGTRNLPLSAGGQLNLYASEITQGGTLRAPLGSINIGWDGTGTAPLDSIFTGNPFPVSKNVTLSSGSVTSVSAVNPVNGQPLLIPYGFSKDGVSWIDPTGVDITAGGFPTKSITVAGANVTTEAGSKIDISGGGDIYAYQWVTGNGGSKDVLASTTSFAVIPGYNSNYAPYGAFNTISDTNNLASSDPGYVNNSLKVGDRVHLGASAGLPSGTYTLLPARYALLPGAFLVTPQSGTPIGSFTKPDGSSLVSGYQFNDLNSNRSVPEIFSRFEIAPASVVRSRSQYVDFTGNAFLSQGALNNNQTVPRLPMDAGHLILQASQTLVVQGGVNAGTRGGGRSGLVDISTPQDIVITGSGTPVPARSLALDSHLLSSFGAESLLIGGVRRTDPLTNQTSVSVRTNSITVNNAGSSLMAPDIILASNKTLVFSPGASVIQTGKIKGTADTLYFGDAAVAGSGNGTLVRVSSDPLAQIIRAGVTQPNAASMIIGAGAQISGTSITLDSTYATKLDPTALLTGQFVNLNSGQISLQLDGNVPVTHNFIGGLVLTGPALQGLQSSRSLSLLSYTTIDVYGSGQVGTSNLEFLALHAAEIRGFNVGSGPAAFIAKDIRIDNIANGTVLGAVAPPTGTLSFNAEVIHLGSNNVKIDQFANLQLNATGGVIFEGAGSLNTRSNIFINTPIIGGARSSTYDMITTGSVIMQSQGGSSSISPGLGATLKIEGSSIFAGSTILLPSGLLTLHATTGDLTVSALLDTRGSAKTFFDLVKYTNGGQINLISDLGAVNITNTGSLNVSAQLGGGNAGTVSIKAPKSTLVINGSLYGEAGPSGAKGSLIIDIARLPGGLLSSITPSLHGFNDSRSIRNRLDSVFTIDGTNVSRIFEVSSDSGTINVTGTIDASGATGGTIKLTAAGNIILQSGALLSVAGQKFDAAGKGGAVYLNAGSAINGRNNTTAYVDIQTGSTIDLSVASVNAASAGRGQFQGALHIRQPQDSTNNLQTIKPINGNLVFNSINPSTITIEGYSLFAVADNIDSSVQRNVFDAGSAFVANTDAITRAFTASQPRLAASLYVLPGAEIFNLSGNLTLGAPNSDTSSDWDLMNYRFGAKGVPGVLTLRASGDIIFYNALSDGFIAINSSPVTGLPTLYNALLATQNALLPANLQSWSYRFSAGSDFSAVDFHQVIAGTGSLLLGKNAGPNPSTSSGSGSKTSAAVDNFFQVIRTGTGDIDIATGRDVRLLNQFATIYTAGVQIPDPTLNGTFDAPYPDASSLPTGSLGDPQQDVPYPAQFAYAGGNVTINALGDIIHQTKDNRGATLQDSQRQLPNNWLYRRGSVDPATGKFGTSPFGDITSTAWWVDYSNFFQGIGALGGGNVTMIAGHDVMNVDGVVPTNALMPGKDSQGNAIAPDASNLMEFGGGNLVVRAGHDINGGVYYVERGSGSLSAGNDITTNYTRSPSANIARDPTLKFALNPEKFLAPQTWLPTTLFLGKGNFDISARNNVLLGQVANTFLLPQGYNNTIAYKTYFSTFSPDSAVNVSSLGGAVTLRQSVTLTPNGVNAAVPALQAWIQEQLIFNPGSGSDFQPWLRLNETNANPFSRAISLLPPSMKVTAFSGDINLVGDLTLYPAAKGTVDLLASGAINGLQQNGTTTKTSSKDKVFGTSQINLSDADPNSLPGVGSPFVDQPDLMSDPFHAKTNPNFLKDIIDSKFSESGSTNGKFAVIQTKQNLHAPGVLHLNDTQPVHLYAATGNISGLTLFSAKSARVEAGTDITDIALYVQNVSTNDISVVSAGRDIVAYTSQTALRKDAVFLNPREPISLSGDIQISGPGTLEVLAGRKLDLGADFKNNADNSLGVGITSIGNGRNPFLPFQGASLIVGAGIGTTSTNALTSPSSGALDGGSLTFTNFITQIINGPDGARYLAELGPVQNLTTTTGTLTSSTQGTILTPTSFKALPTVQQDIVALNLFYLALRDAGRDHNIAGTTGFGNYNGGFAAISALFPSNASTQGNITTQSRNIITKSGGDISIFAPTGSLTLQTTTTDSSQTPPGIITQSGGNISIFTHGNVDLGISRIFTLRGGNEIIWSSTGNIAAGSSAKTVQSAPPTRVLIDPQSGNIQTDLAGLATGGGIGVLATVTGVAPGNVDLIAPVGTVDAGDAGIRATGNLNIAATAVLNASNISVSGTSTGTPTAPTVTAPNISGLAAASNTGGAANSAADTIAKETAKNQAAPTNEELPSIIVVDVLGYGAGEEGQ